MIRVNLIYKACTACKHIKPAREFESPLVAGLTNRCAGCRERGNSAHNKYVNKNLPAKRRWEAEHRRKKIALPTDPKTKVCRACLVELPLDAFSISNQGALYKTCDECREWCRENEDRIRAGMTEEQKKAARGYSRNRRREERDKVLDHYGRQCACCGEKRVEFLALDHEDGNGAEHRRAVGWGGRVYRWLIQNNFPAGFRILCHNCNAARGYYGYCPHELEREGKHPIDGMIAHLQVEGTVQ